MLVQCIGRNSNPPKLTMIDEPFQQDPTRPPSTGPSSGESPGENLEGAVLQSLMRLTSGNPVEFKKFRMPPSKILDWIDRADREQLHGLLISTIRRWHELRDRDSGKNNPT